MAALDTKDPVQLAGNLTAMTDDELFSVLRDLERASEQTLADRNADVLAQIALAATEIETRFPGQAMSPYKDWLRRQVI